MNLSLLLLVLLALTWKIGLTLVFFVVVESISNSRSSSPMDSACTTVGEYAVLAVGSALVQLTIMSDTLYPVLQNEFDVTRDGQPLISVPLLLLRAAAISMAPVIAAAFVPKLGPMMLACPGLYAFTIGASMFHVAHSSGEKIAFASNIDISHVLVNQTELLLACVASVIVAAKAIEFVASVVIVSVLGRRCEISSKSLLARVARNLPRALSLPAGLIGAWKYGVALTSGTITMSGSLGP